LPKILGDMRLLIELGSASFGTHIREVMRRTNPDARSKTRVPRLVRALARFAKRHAYASTIALAVVSIFGDYATGVDIVAFTLVYVMPVALATWWRGARWGIAVSALCIAGAIAVEVVGQLEHGRAIHGANLLWNNGGAFGMFLLIVFLVARVQAHAAAEARERRIAVDQLRQVERLGVVGRLAAGLAHELGTPLNVIVGYAEILATEDLTKPTIASASTTILAQTRKMTAIIRGLLDFSRRGAAERSNVDLRQLAKNAAAILQPLANRTGSQISIESSSEDVLVSGSPTELEQVLVNLMMNGLQAMPSGGTLHVRVASRGNDSDGHSPHSTDDDACVEVEDEGIGIAPESLPRIFDPFFTTKDVGEGTGLGLSVSYGIVSDHGGRIRVTSSPGAGSRFSVFLPRALA
jgi:signal transduction histidine kinase